MSGRTKTTAGPFPSEAGRPQPGRHGRRPPDEGERSAAKERQARVGARRSRAFFNDGEIPAAAQNRRTSEPVLRARMGHRRHRWTGVIRVKRIFDFLKSRDARISCPFCGHGRWQGWDERVALEHVIGNTSVDRKTEAFPLTCANCGFIRLQSAHVLDDPRASTRNAPEASE